MTTEMVASIGFFAVCLSIIFAGFCLAALRLMFGSRKKGALEAEESQMLQELYHGLREMQERIEAIETLLLDRDRKEQ